MILYGDDWVSHPGAIIDTKTTNLSFLRLAAMYKNMGIRNHAFILSLLDPSLQGVDPYDPNLTSDQQLAIAIECKLNFWYYIREVIRLPGSEKGRVVRFIANRGNIAMYWLYMNHVTSVLIQPRQTGKSFSSDTLSSWLMNVGCLNTTINLLTKDDRLRSSNLNRLKDLCDELPKYLRQRTKGDISNTEELSVKSLSNRYLGHVPNSSPKMALKVGRGLTSPTFFIDEFSFISNIEISLSAALAGGINARRTAEANGDPYGTIMTTTAGKKDDRDGRYAFKIVSESAIWTESFYDSTDIANLETLVKGCSPGGVVRVNCTFSHRQLGYTDQWLAKVLDETMAKDDDADRDLFNIWTSGSLTSPLPTKIVETIRASQVSDAYNEISGGNKILKWYVPMDSIERVMSSGHYILSMDTSDASGGDDISLLITDICTGGVIAAGSYNETNLISFASWVCGLLIRFKKMTAIIERRSTGGMILDYLMLMLPAKGEDPFKRLFNRVVNDSDTDKDRFIEIKENAGTDNEYFYTKHKKSFGFATSGSGMASRTDLYSVTLQAAAKNIGVLIKDPKTIDQLLSLTIRNGRVDHPDGGHDDMVIALLMSYWILTQGKNLSYYGIDSSKILSKMNQISDGQPKLHHYDVREQESIRVQIEEAYNIMISTDNEHLYRRAERRVIDLNSRLILKDNETFSLDDLLESLEKEKRFNRHGAKSTPTRYDNYQNIVTTIEDSLFG